LTESGSGGRRGRFLWPLLRTAVALALLTYLARSGAIDWSAVLRWTRTWWLMPTLIVLACFGAILEALRLGFVCRSQAIVVSLFEGLRLVLIAMFFGIVVPGGTGGDVLKIYYLVSAHRGRAVEVATVLVAERAIAMVVLLLLVCVLGALNYPLLAADATLATLVGIAALALVTVLAGAVAVSSERVRAGRPYRFVTQRLPLGHWVERGAEALRLLRGHPTAVGGTFGVAMVSQLAMVFTFLIIASVALPDAPPRATPLLALLGMFANALPITPAGLGVGEAAFDQLFLRIDVVGGASLMIAWRIALLPLYAAGGILYAVGRKAQPEPSSDS